MEDFSVSNISYTNKDFRRDGNNLYILALFVLFIRIKN